MLFLLCSLILADEPKPDEVINGMLIYHSQGIAKTYRHINLTLTPENTLLPSDPKITNRHGLSRKPQNYRKNILDEQSENFRTGQFEIYIPVNKFPLAKPKSGYMIVRMPSTLTKNEVFIKEKQNLYLRIAEMIEKNTGSVRVVLELPDSMPRNLFFRTASGRYVDYVGQFSKDRSSTP